MKVRELISKAHLFSGQKIKLNDMSTGQTFITKDRYAFDIDSEEVDRLLCLRVNTFNVNNTGLIIWAK